MYSICKDSFIDSIKSPLRTSTQTSSTFSNISYLLNSIPESIVIISEKGIILEINSATSRLFGWTKDEIINRKNISFLLTNRDGEKLMNTINNEELSTLIDSSYHYHGLNKNGSTFPCDISLGIFPKSLLDNFSSSSSDLSNSAIIAVISVKKKGYRSSDSVLLDLKSRYQNEYDEIETLGKGGFGQVYKARNRLDGQLYAIKKIKLQSKPKEFSNSFDLQGFENLKSLNSNNSTSTTTSNLSFLSAEDLRIVREVKTFARISNHPNIVRYHASWIEVEEKIKKNKRKGSFDSEASSDTSNDCSSEDETDDTDDDKSNVNDNENEKSKEIFNNSFGFQQQLNFEDSYSFSNNCSISNNVNFHSHSSSSSTSSEEINTNNQQSTSDFIISFAESKNSESQDNLNEYFINMENLDTSRFSNSNSKNDDTTNINSLEDTSYNPFSFRQDDNESNSNNQVSVLKYNNQNGRSTLSKRAKGKLGLDPINTSVMKPLEKKNNLMLYLIIQMELCSGQTLETWIHERNQLTEKKEIHVDRRVIFKIFKQIVQAIAHVHWNGCIHRDVKPANVFLQDDNHILLGDFGLAKDVDFTVPSPKTETIPFSTTLVNNEDEMEETEISEPKEINEAETEINSDHVSKMHKFTSGIGTYIYASPEQLASSQGYDNKTDIYSLGILLFELLWPFKTGMERIKTLTNIRNGKFPENFVEKWPLELPFLRSLLNPDPALRPTAQEILDSEVLNINYITPLYNNPTNLLNALDLRVTRVSLDPNDSVLLDKTTSKEKRKGHNKTLSTASKINKNYGDCGACKQKDMAISSFRSQFVKTKEQINYLEDTVSKASKRLWVVSIVTFVLGCVLTLGITLLILNRNGGYYNTSSIVSSGPSAIEIKDSLTNNNNNNFDMSAFVPESTKVYTPIINTPAVNAAPTVFNTETSSSIVDSYENQKLDHNIETIEKVEVVNNSNNLHKRNNKMKDKRRKERKNDKMKEKRNGNVVMNNKNFVVTQTLSINYFYKSRTITVTRTKTKSVNFVFATTTTTTTTTNSNTQDLNNSTPTILENI